MGCREGEKETINENDSKCFSLDNWKDRVTINKLGNTGKKQASVAGEEGTHRSSVLDMSY